MSPHVRRFPTALRTLLLAVGCHAAGCVGSTDGFEALESGPPGSERVESSSGGLDDAALRIEVSLQSSGTDALLQAVSPVSPEVVWVSGHEGRWLRTEDGGATWHLGRGPGGDSLQFRDVDAFDASTAYLMSAGVGPSSRIYRTDDGGVSWELQYVPTDPDAFLDCMAFWSPEVGVAYGDAVDDELFILRTEDGGRTWSRVPDAPAAQPDEGGFAASGRCAIARAGGRGWIVTGNAESPRILRTTDRGRSWEVIEAPVVGGSAAGLTAVAVDGARGVSVGGVIGQDTLAGSFVAVSGDGGETWREGGPLAHPGPLYGVDLVPGLAEAVAVAGGPGRLEWSVDGGMSWRVVETETYWAVGFAASDAGWAVGPGGRIASVTIRSEGGG